MPYSAGYNGNVVTRDFDVAAFNEVNQVLPTATVNYSVADHYSCHVTLDENQ